VSILRVRFLPASDIRSMVAAALISSLFLLSACSHSAGVPTSSTDDAMLQSPHSLAIYYGWPSTVYDQQSPDLSPLEIFSRYQVVVLGGGLADTQHGDHENAIVLINTLEEQGVAVFGYIDMGLITRSKTPSFDDLKQEVEQWKTMGVSGIFWDDAGHDE